MLVALDLSLGRETKRLIRCIPEDFVISNAERNFNALDLSYSRDDKTPIGHSFQATCHNVLAVFSEDLFISNGVRPAQQA